MSLHENFPCVHVPLIPSARFSVKPTSNAQAWDFPSSSSQTIKLNPQYAKNTSTAPPEFHFDELITGSENKPVYNKVARNHVISAMEGYNSVVFAYGQTASGKTFTLVCSVLAPPPTNASTSAKVFDFFCRQGTTTNPALFREL